MADFVFNLLPLILAVSLTTGCQKEVITYKDAVCEEDEEALRKNVRNSTPGIDDGCNRCFCREGQWRCEQIRCGCMPGTLFHTWNGTHKLACYCRFDGIPDFDDCTKEWVYVRERRRIRGRASRAWKRP